MKLSSSAPDRQPSEPTRKPQKPGTEPADQDWTPPLALAVGIGRQLNLAAKATRQYLDRRLAAAGGSYVVWTVLRVLVREETLIQRELAERLFIEGPTLTHHLARMERDGLVVRKRAESDRRATQVEVTDKGHDLYERLAQVVFDGSINALASLTVEDVDQLQRHLSVIIENCETTPPIEPGPHRDCPA
jgi:MarR family transcriptional regulator for hemolysin